MRHISPTVLKTIKQLEITTRRMLNGSLVGDSRSALKGSGLEFDQIREYQQGDDVRFVDWRASARADKLLVKQYIEERNRTVLIAVDCSASSFYGSGELSRYELMAQVASVLALAADYGKDQTSLMLFTDEVELFIPAGKGHNHVRALMEALFTHKPRSKKTCLGAAIERAAELKRSDTIVCLLSDFIDESYDKGLAALARRHDVVAVCCRDSREKFFTSCGFVSVQDSESGQEVCFDTSSTQSDSLNTFLREREESAKSLFKKLHIDSLELSSDEDFWRTLITFFRRRMSY